MDAKEQPYLGNLRGFVSFLSFSGCGHSLISSLIDAHKDAVVSREIGILSKLFSGVLGKEGAISAIFAHSKKYTSSGRYHKGSNTSHLVPNQFNGTSAAPQILGDKLGYNTVANIARKPDFLTTVLSTLDLPIYFIHIYRNPLDVVSHTRKFYTQFSLYETVCKVRRKYLLTHLAVKRIKTLPLLSIKIEDFVEKPKSSLITLLSFLKLDNYTHYIDDCASIINPSLLVERDDVKWDTQSFRETELICKSFNYLNCYT